MNYTQWRKTLKGVWYDLYHPPIYRPKGEGINKRIRSHGKQ